MWERLQKTVRKFAKYPAPAELALFRPVKREPVKSRPAGLADSYALVEDEEILEGVFHRLKAAIWSEIDEARAKLFAQGVMNPPVLREHGRVSNERQYFYLKPPRDTGWLFERSGTGWVISRADKVVEENLFIRRGEPWDFVAVFGSKNGPPVGSHNVRLSSPKLRADLLSFNVYQKKLVEMINRGDTDTYDGLA
jgi:hypothetical protein